MSNDTFVGQSTGTVAKKEFSALTSRRAKSLRRSTHFLPHRRRWPGLYVLSRRFATMPAKALLPHRLNKFG